MGFPALFFTLALLLVPGSAGAAEGAFTPPVSPESAAAVSWTLHEDNHIAPDREVFRSWVGLPREKVSTVASLQEFEQAFQRSLQSVGSSTSPELFVHLSSHGVNGAICEGDRGRILYRDLIAQLLRKLDNAPNPASLTLNFVVIACYSGSFIPEIKKALERLPPEKRPGIQVLTSAPADEVSHGVDGVGSHLLQSLEKAGRWLRAVEKNGLSICAGCTPFQRLAKLVGRYSLTEDTPLAWSNRQALSKWSTQELLGLLSTREQGIDGTEKILQQLESELVDQLAVQEMETLEPLKTSLNASVKRELERVQGEVQKEKQVRAAWKAEGVQGLRGLYERSPDRSLRLRIAAYLERQAPRESWDVLIHAQKIEGYPSQDLTARAFNAIMRQERLTLEQVRLLLDLPILYPDIGTNLRLLLSRRADPQEQRHVLEWVENKLKTADLEQALELYHALRFRKPGFYDEAEALLTRIHADEFPIVFDAVVDYLERHPNSFFYNSPNEDIARFRLSDRRLKAALGRLAEKAGYRESCPELFRVL